MKLIKKSLLALAALALTLSTASLVTAGPLNQTQDVWDVDCTYNGDEQLISKSCSTGGSYGCNCA